MEGHDLPRHEALQQDEATRATHFRPAVLVPGGMSACKMIATDWSIRMDYH